MNILIELFTCFLQIGLFTFGGGYAMISLIEEKCVSKKKWITHDELVHMTVIAESTPGPIAINCATFVGYKKAGFVGAIVATIGVVIPSFVIIYILSVHLGKIMEEPIVDKAFWGIRIAVGILIVKVAINMIKNMKKNLFSILIMIVSCMVMLAVNFGYIAVSSLYVLAASGLLGLIAFCLNRANEWRVKG